MGEIGDFILPEREREREKERERERESVHACVFYYDTKL